MGCLLVAQLSTEGTLTNLKGYAEGELVPDLVQFNGAGFRDREGGFGQARAGQWVHLPAEMPLGPRLPLLDTWYALTP